MQLSTMHGYESSSSMSLKQPPPSSPQFKHATMPPPLSSMHNSRMQQSQTNSPSISGTMPGSGPPPLPVALHASSQSLTMNGNTNSTTNNGMRGYNAKNLSSTMMTWNSAIVSGTKTSPNYQSNQSYSHSGMNKISASLPQPLQMMPSSPVHARTPPPFANTMQQQQRRSEPPHYQNQNQFSAQPPLPLSLPPPPPFGGIQSVVAASPSWSTSIPDHDSLQYSTIKPHAAQQIQNANQQAMLATARNPPPIPHHQPQSSPAMQPQVQGQPLPLSSHSRMPSAAYLTSAPPPLVANSHLQQSNQQDYQDAQYGAADQQSTDWNTMKMTNNFTKSQAAPPRPQTAPHAPAIDAAHSFAPPQHPRSMQPPALGSPTLRASPKSDARMISPASGASNRQATMPAYAQSNPKSNATASAANAGLAPQFLTSVPRLGSSPPPPPPPQVHSAGANGAQNRKLASDRQPHSFQHQPPPQQQQQQQQSTPPQRSFAIPPPRKPPQAVQPQDESELLYPPLFFDSPWEHNSIQSFSDPPTPCDIDDPHKRWMREEAQIGRQEQYLNREFNCLVLVLSTENLAWHDSTEQWKFHQKNPSTGTHQRTPQ